VSPTCVRQARGEIPDHTLYQWRRLGYRQFPVDRLVTKPEDSQTVVSKQNAIRINTFPPERDNVNAFVFRLHERKALQKEVAIYQKTYLTLQSSRFSWSSSVSPGKGRDSDFKLGHDRFLPQPFQFITHSPSCHSPLYSISY
jgi:hypothetical protein